MENKYWKRCVGTLIGAIWLYTLAGIAGGVTEFVNGLLDPGGMMGMMASMMGGDVGSAFGTGDLLEYFFPLLVLLGYYLFFSSLSQFMRLQRSDADRDAVGKVRKAYVLLLVAVLLGYLWIPGRIAALVVTIVAYARMLSGYKALKRSATFPEEARRGAGLLHASTVWLLVGYVLGCIPLVGGAVESLIGLAVFFCVLAGWGRIRRGAPELTGAEAAVLEQEEADRSRVTEGQKKTLGIALLLLVGLPVIFNLIHVAFGFGWIADRELTFSLPNGYRTIRLYQSLLSDFSRILFLTLYLYLLLNKRLRLGVLSRVGLGMMVLVQLASIPMQIFHYGLVEQPEWMTHIVLGLFYSLVNWTYFIGLLLFVWGSYAGLRAKVVLTAKGVVVNLGVVGSLLRKALYAWYEPDGEMTSEVWSAIQERIAQTMSLIWLGVLLVFFLLLLWAVVSWWKKTEAVAELPASLE